MKLIWKISKSLGPSTNHHAPWKFVKLFLKDGRFSVVLSLKTTWYSGLMARKIHPPNIIFYQLKFCTSPIPYGTGSWVNDSRLPVLPHRIHDIHHKNDKNYFQIFTIYTCWVPNLTKFLVLKIRLKWVVFWMVLPDSKM